MAPGQYKWYPHKKKRKFVYRDNMCGWKMSEDTGKMPREEGGSAWGSCRPRNPKDHGQSSRREKRQGRIVLQFSGAARPCRHLDLRLVAPRTVRQSSSAVLSHPCAALACGSPRKVTQQGRYLLLRREVHTISRILQGSLILKEWGSTIFQQLGTPPMYIFKSEPFYFRKSFWEFTPNAWDNLKGVKNNQFSWLEFASLMISITQSFIMFSFLLWIPLFIFIEFWGSDIFNTIIWVSGIQLYSYNICVLYFVFIPPSHFLPSPSITVHPPFTFSYIPALPFPSVNHHMIACV